MADLIRIRSYTGQERPAIDRARTELRAIVCDRVWMDLAGNVLGASATGRRVRDLPANLERVLLGKDLSKGGSAKACKLGLRSTPID